MGKEKKKKQLAKLEILFYEDEVHTTNEGDNAAIIVGLASLIEDQSEKNKFNYFMQSAVSLLLQEHSESAKKKDKKKKPSKKKKDEQYV